MPKRASRLLMIVPYLVVGGAEKFELDLIRQLKLWGWDITVVTTLANEDPWLAEFSKLTPDVLRLHTVVPFADHPEFLSRLIDIRAPDVILVTHSEFGYELLPYIRSRHPDIPILDYCHLEEEWWGGGFPQCSIDHQDQLNVTMVSSEHLRRWMSEHGARQHLEVVYTGAETIDRDELERVRERVRRAEGLGDHDVVILYAGRLVAQKRPRLFVDVFRELHRRGKGFIAWIAGEGPESARLRRFAVRHRLAANMQLCGQVSVARMRELMMAADIFFLPSEYEGIALSLYEAMAAECAVVAADVGGQQELVTDGSGVLIRRGPDELDQYVLALERLIDDDVYRRGLARAAQRRVTSEFSLEQMGNRVVSCFALAQELQREQPAPEVTHSDGLEQASAAVRAAQLHSENLRRVVLPTARESMLERTYAWLLDVAGPLYRLALRSRLKWVARANEMVKRRIVARHDRRVARGEGSDRYC